MPQRAHTATDLFGLFIALLPNWFSHGEKPRNKQGCSYHGEPERAAGSGGFDLHDLFDEPGSRVAVPATCGYRHIRPRVGCARVASSMATNAWHCRQRKPQYQVPEVVLENMAPWCAETGSRVGLFWCGPLGAFWPSSCAPSSRSYSDLRPTRSNNDATKSLNDADDSDSILTVAHGIGGADR